jgi:hypothetical protein
LDAAKEVGTAVITYVIIAGDYTGYYCIIVCFVILRAPKKKEVIVSAVAATPAGPTQEDLLIQTPEIC